MSQRSQIYVRYQDEDGDYKLIARDYSWNFMERMISRCRYTMEWLQENVKYLSHYPKRLIRILDTNFDMKDCMISNDLFKNYKHTEEEHDDNPYYSFYNRDLNDYLFFGIANDDGKLFIDIDNTGNIKYALLDHCNIKVMDATGYIKWDGSEDELSVENESRAIPESLDSWVKRLECEFYFHLYENKKYTNL